MKITLLSGLILFVTAFSQCSQSGECVGSDCPKSSATSASTIGSASTKSSRSVSQEIPAKLTEKEEKLIEELYVGKQYEIDISDDPWTGDKDANVILVTYKDFLCGSCALWAETLHKVLKREKRGVKLAFRHYPLDTNCKHEIRDKGPHRGASLAAMASRAAQLQNKFWAMHDLLFAKQDSYADKKYGPVYSRENIDEIAREANLDMVKYKEFMDSPTAKEWMESKINQACATVDDEKQRIIISTPTIFVNGVELDFDKLGKNEYRFEDFIHAMVKKYPPSPVKQG